MAKVTAPLLSLDASGSVGNAMVFSKWKGRNYVRVLVTPKNLQSEGQAEVRTILAAVGKNNKQIGFGGTLYTQIVAVTPVDQSWISYFGSTMIGVNHTDFDAVKAFYDNVANATITGYFDTEAPDEGLSDFELPYGTYGAVSAGLQLMAAYDAAFRLGLAIAPAALADVSNAQVQAFGAAYAAA